MAGLCGGGRPLLWLIILGLFYLGSCQFHFISLARTYSEAKTYCRQWFTDLATVHNASEMAEILSISIRQGRAWIGLELGRTQTWHWSEAEHAVDFFNWAAAEPGDSSQDRCVAMDAQGGWFQSDCDTRRSFVCHDGVSLLFVATQKSWRNAQRHCRDLSQDLVSIHSAAQNQAVRTLTSNQIVWTGLFQDAWVWSDGSPSAFRFWKPNQPNYLTAQECAVTVLRDDGRWNDLRCRLTLRFFCQGPSRDAQTTSQTSTLADRRATTAATQPRGTSVVDPTTAAPQQQSTSPHVSPPTRTAALTRPTPLSNATTKATTVAVTRPTLLLNATTKATTVAVTRPTAIFSATTKATTVAVTRPTAIFSATTKARTVASTQPTTHNNATTNASIVVLTQPTLLLNATTKSGVSATQLSTATDMTLPTHTATTGWTSYAVTTSGQHSSLGEYILIRKNLTWMEALSYCRHHHADLADIPTTSAQELAAALSRNATTAHVWLGLRFTCNFGFWFWTSSASLCYHNWGPGHGSAADYGCGATGAMEATGGQQWVGLPETRKLNFICRLCQ
ncbi:uncharacterized protein LOC128771745 [Synchiropus splendidus]|uniref:uncharacterized protein LOC128771745 n=1 Tax=Synchiropus splendidus TaxID=270530 RepID=UPI00237E9B6C|nr:uncharacterized protein LOC128771745 [Synchiropus splendidus]